MHAVEDVKIGKPHFANAQVGSEDVKGLCLRFVQEGRAMQPKRVSKNDRSLQVISNDRQQGTRPFNVTRKCGTVGTHEQVGHLLGTAQRSVQRKLLASCESSDVKGQPPVQCSMKTSIVPAPKAVRT